MADVEAGSVDGYIAAQPEAVQGILERVRSAICQALPDAEEYISYQIPTYKIRGRAVLYFAGWKKHYSIYPASAGLVLRFKDDLVPYEVRKGTIRFPLSEPVPSELIRNITQFRAQEAAKESGVAGNLATSMTL